MREINFSHSTSSEIPHFFSFRANLIFDFGCISTVKNCKYSSKVDFGTSKIVKLAILEVLHHWNWFHVKSERQCYTQRDHTALAISRNFYTRTWKISVKSFYLVLLVKNWFHEIFLHFWILTTVIVETFSSRPSPTSSRCWWSRTSFYIVNALWNFDVLSRPLSYTRIKIDLETAIFIVIEIVTMGASEKAVVRSMSLFRIWICRRPHSVEISEICCPSDFPSNQFQGFWRSKIAF